jgi:hypothetical protein
MLELLLADGQTAKSFRQPCGSEKSRFLEIRIGNVKASGEAQAEGLVLLWWGLMLVLEVLESFGNESEMLARHRHYIL